MTSRRISSLALVTPLTPETVGDESERRSTTSDIAPAKPSHRSTTTVGRAAANQLVSILLEQIEEAEEPTRRIALLHEVASVYEEKLAEPERAFDAMLVAWAEDYSDEGTAQALSRLAPVVQGWAELLTVANDALLKPDLEPRKRLALCLRCAIWYSDQLGRPDSAIACYEQALAIDPGHLPATLRLSSLYEAAEQWDTLATVLEHAALLTTEAEEKVRLYLRLAALYEGPLSRPAKAESYYRLILQLEAANSVALEALEGIYRRDQRWDDLVALLQKTAANGSSAQAANKALLNLAKIWHGVFHNPGEAIAAYEQVLARDSLNLAALRGLEVLYGETERWQGLLSVLESQTHAVESDRERVETLTKLAALWEQRFVKPEKAVVHLEQAQAIDPANGLVLANLARLYRQAKRWPDLLATLESTLGVTTDPTHAVAAHKAIAVLCTNEIQDLPRAIRAYEQVHAVAVSDVEVLRGLVQLYERTDNVRAAVESMERLARIEEDDERRADLLLRMGVLYQHKLNDQEAAIERYERAAALKPKRCDILRALREAQVEAGDFRAAARTLGEELSVARSPRTLSELHLTLSHMLTEKLHESEKAIVHLEAACVHDAANMQAALALAEVYVRKGQWATALPLLKRVVKQGNSLPNADPKEHGVAHGISMEARKRAAFLLGEVAGRCEEHTVSALGYEQALALDARDLRSALGAACAHFRAENWLKVQEGYEKVLGDFRAELDAETKAQAFRRVGLALLALGNRRKALSMFESALKALPEDAQTLQTLVTLHQDAREWKKVIRYKTLLAEASPQNERERLHCEIAAHYRDQLDNPRKAIDALCRALEDSPSSRVVLHELLSLYQHAKRWRDAIFVIEQIAALEQQPEIAAKYLYTAGVIARDGVGDAHGALDLFEKTLDRDPSQLKAFEAINRLLTQHKDWKRLERAFRKMLHRLSAGSAETELLHQLWHGLGVIYRDRLGDLASAAQAFKEAGRLKPDSDTQHCILAELYERIPGELKRAVREHNLRIERDPTSPAPYQALYDLYRRHQASDRAWCVARALVHLKRADPEQRSYYDSFRGKARFNGKGLTYEDWLKHLYHPDHDRMLATIFRCIAGPLHERRFGAAMAASSQGKKVRSDDEEALSAHFGAGIELLSPDIRPRVTLNPAAPHGLRCEVGAVPASVAGRVVFELKRESELRFLIGHHLAYHRSEHYIRKLLPARQELGAAFLVAMRSIGQSDNSRGTEKAWADLSRGLAPEALERIQKACTLFAKRGEQANLKRFIQTTELTACYAGLLFADNLSASIAMVQQLEPAGADDVSPNEKTTELLKFSVSEHYFELRRKVGIVVP